MKTDLLIVPSDTLVIGGSGEVVDRLRSVARFSEALFHSLLKNAYVASYCDEGFATYRKGCASCSKSSTCSAFAVAGSFGERAPGLRVTALMLATGIEDRLEPLFVVPDDLQVEPGPEDAVWAQPSYLEGIPQDLIQHDLGDLQVLIPQSRNTKVKPFEAFLTRKGVRVWSERKAQRLTEGEHYWPSHRLFELETRSAQGEASIHLRMKPNVGFVISVETIDGHPGFETPIVVDAGGAGRTVRVQQVQVPQPSLDDKPRKRWRVCLLSEQAQSSGAWPGWVDGSTKTTRAPLPEGGKVVAVAKKAPLSAEIGQHAPAAVHHVKPSISAGTTFFVEYEEPVRIEQSAEILAGGS